MTKLTTAAWVAHELGLAASFGGLLFGKLALNTNLEGLDNKSDRGKLLNKTWNRYEAARLLRRVNVLGNVNIAVLGGAIAVSTILSMKANESVRWSLLSRLLP